MSNPPPRNHFPTSVSGLDDDDDDDDDDIVSEHKAYINLPICNPEAFSSAPGSST